MLSKHCFLWAFLSVLAIMIGAPIAGAQSASTALVSGTVKDPTGAVVAGSTVTLINHGTGVTQAAKTGKDGRYVFPAVNPGDYSVNFTAQGFATTLVNELHVEVEKNYTVNMSLQLGSTSQTVSVSEAANSAELQTTTATVGEVLGGASLEALPVYTRSASALLFYQPAVSPGGQIAGARDEQITFSLDGGDVTSDLDGNNTYAAPPGEPSPSPVVPIPVESTQEFEVATTNPNSTFARSSGGQVALITKSGTSSFHGSLYEYHNDDGLNANGWTNDFLKIRKPHNVDNRFGGTVGGPIWKDKVFFFVNYEGRRFYDDTIFNAVIPTATLKAGILQFPDASGAVDQYSFQPGNITTACGGLSCDPRGIGMSPTIQSQLALYPSGNNPSLGDGLNTTGDTFNSPTPILEDIGVARLDYKINTKWSSFATLHTSETSRVGTEQFSLLAQQSVAEDPIRPWYATYQLTGQLTPSLTSVTHGSYLYDWWGWTRINPAPLVSGTDEALALAGEGTGTSNSTSKLIADPIVIATQSARSRFYDGHKWYFAQDFSWTKGTQVFQFGGSGYISRDVFEKTDNYAGGLTTGPIDYVESTGNGSAEYLNIPASDRPPTCGGSVTTACLTSANILRYNELYASVLGLVDRSSQVLTRDGSFQPNSLGTPLISHTLIPAANAYFQDIWQARKNLVITGGIDWQVQPTPHERDGKNDVLVYANTNTPVDYQNYFQQRGRSLNAGVAPGQVYNPLFGVDPVNALAQPWTGDVRTTDWHEFGPRISAAWQINNKTVMRGGYAIVYERIDDIDEISLDLTTGGLLDVDACGGPIASGGSAVCTNGATDPSNAYRIGVDGSSVPVPTPFAAPIPYVPSGTAAQPFGLFMMSGWDPYLHPGHDDSVDWTVQRELPGKMILEVGYIGRFSHNLFNEAAYNASDYLMKDAASGQTYAQAFDGVAVPLRGGVKPYVANSSGVITGANSAFPDEAFFDNQIGTATCTAQNFPGTSIAYPNCAAMVATQDPTDLINGSLNDFSLDEFNRVTPTPVDNIQTFQSYAITDGGFSNYNAGFLTLKKSFSQGVQFQFNWTWSHAIGNQGVDQQSGSTSNSPYNLNLDKSSEAFDHRHVITAWLYGELPFGQGRHFNVDNPTLNKIVGGWYTSGVFNFSTGSPLHINADGDYGTWESAGTAAVCTSSLDGLSGQYYDVTGSGGVGTSGNPASHGTGANLFADPSAVYNSCSRPMLSTDTQIPFDELVMPSTWNVDWAIGKDLHLTERYKLTFSAQMFNVFNVVNFRAPTLNLNSPTNFGVFTTQSNTPRRILLGLHFQF